MAQTTEATVDEQYIRQEYEKVLTQLYNSPETNNEQVIQRNLSSLRALVLKYGIPNDTEQQKMYIVDSSSTGDHSAASVLGDEKDHYGLRGRVYKAFIRITQVDVNFYLQLLSAPAESDDYNIGVADAKRTFQEFSEYKARVSNSKMQRLLNCYAVQYGGKSSKFHLKQGISYVAGVLLYCMNEAEAFYCFKRCATVLFPNLYASTDPSKAMEVEYACGKLIENMIYYFDRDLFDLFGWKYGEKTSGFLEFRMWGPKHISSFFAQGQDLQQVLKLFDFFFAFGFHNLVIVVVAAIINMREELFNIGREHEQFMQRQKALREKLYDLRIKDARQVIDTAVVLLMQLPEDLHSKMENVMKSQEVVEELYSP